MGIVIRQSIKGSIVSYIGAAIGMVSTIFIYPYFLSPELIGLNRILVDSAFLFAFVAQIGIPNAIIRFTPQLKKMGLSREAYKYALLIPLISFVFFGTLVYLGKEGIQGLFDENSPLYSRFFPVIIPFGLVCIYMNIIENIAASFYRITVPKLIREIILRFLLIGSAMLFFYFKALVIIFKRFPGFPKLTVDVSNIVLSNTYTDYIIQLLFELKAHIVIFKSFGIVVFTLV